MNPFRILVENVTGHGTRLLDYRTRMLLRLLRRVDSNRATTLYPRRDVYGSNGSRRNTMTYDADGLEWTTNALETAVIGIRFYDAVSPRHCSSGPGFFASYYLSTGQRQPPFA